MQFWRDGKEGVRTWKVRVPNEFAGTGIDEEHYAEKQELFEWAKGGPVPSAGYAESRLKTRVLGYGRIQLLGDFVIYGETALKEGNYRMFSYAAEGCNYLADMPSSATPYAELGDWNGGVVYAFVRARDDAGTLILWSMYKLLPFCPAATAYHISAGLALGHDNLMEENL